MNDLLHPCEAWAEALSLAAAGCLSDVEARDVLRHVDACPACRERYQQLRGLCSVLTAAAPADAGTSAVVERVMSAIAASDAPRPRGSAAAEIAHATLSVRSWNPWRWIMRSSLTRSSAAAIFVLAIAGVALWFHGEGATPALANFLTPLLEAKTLKFKTSSDFGEKTGKVSGEILVMAPNRLRMEQEITQKVMSMSTAFKMIEIMDTDVGKTLHLSPSLKQATITTYTNMPKEKGPRPLFLEIQSQLRDAWDRPDWIREPLGDKTVDGRRLAGYRLTGHGMIIELWGDPQTGMPIRMVCTSPSIPEQRPVVFSDFIFNVPLDEALFGLEPPAGYLVQRRTQDMSPAEEKDLLEMFRRYSQLSGGLFPDKLDLMAIINRFMTNWQKTHPLRLSSSVAKLGQKEEPWMNEALKKLVHSGVSIDLRQPPRQSDAHYSEAGIRSFAAAAPILWLKPKGAQQYRVVYGDFSVKDSAAPPKVIDARAVDNVPAFLQLLAENWNKAHPAEQPATPFPRDEREAQQEFDEMLQLTRGISFAFEQLPRAANAHYAGKGIKLGDAAAPVFWYRPKGAAKYRVIYGDLSIREADAPPNVAGAQPVVSAAGPK